MFPPRLDLADEQMEREAVQRRYPPAPLVAHPDSAAKPTSSSRCKKRRRGVTSCCSAGEEVGPMPADMRAAASIPASSSATAPSAALPIPSSLTPAQVSVATPDELEEWLRFFARQIKSFRRVSLLHHSPELKAEGSRALLLQSSPRQVSRALLQSSPRQVSRALLQSSPHQGPDDTSSPALATEGPDDASAPALATEGLGNASAPALATEGLGHASAPAHATEGLGDPSAPAPGLKAFQGYGGRLVLVLVPKSCDEGFEDEPPTDPVPERFKERLVLIMASDEGFEDEPPPDPVPEWFEKKLVLVSTSKAGDEGLRTNRRLILSIKERLVLVLASKGLPGSVPVSEGPVGSVPVSGGSPGTVNSKPDSKPPEFLRVLGGSSTLHGRRPDLPDRGSSTLLGRPPDPHHGLIALIQQLIAPPGLL
ncbi:hypothetical protein CRENBAI_018173 [Crenichthys baileyi]|uniref:Uncharacterized protein n=1 Tax=Crenichthys baileyi TaxID=28760 RepID=A0AAV9QZ82_9TELE